MLVNGYPKFFEWLNPRMRQDIDPRKVSLAPRGLRSSIEKNVTACLLFEILQGRTLHLSDIYQHSFFRGRRDDAGCQRWCLDEHRRRDSQSLRLEVWSEPVGSSIVTPRAKDTEAMQSTMVRMARPRHSQDRVVQRRGRETTSSCEVDAYT